MKFKIFIAIIFLIIFSLNIFINYQVYNELIKDKIVQEEFIVENVYNKELYDVLKLSTNKYFLFTSVDKNLNLEKVDRVKLAFITNKITFLDFLKGFYVQNIFIEKIEKPNSLKEDIYQNIKLQHNTSLNQDLFSALFLAIPISSELRDITNTFGISHLLALSGFHLGLILFCSYWIIYAFYSPLHQKYVPYRNKKFDALVVSGVMIFTYLIFTNVVPSLLRAFVMFVFGLYLLRNNIKIFSFLNLFLVLLIIVALFPKYAFSISLWFSISGVFYILLYVKYFSSLNKYISFLLFNFWIFFALNPIILYFFDVVSYAQLFSAPITLAFILFYPFEIVLHLLEYGYILDKYLLWLFELNFEVKTYITEFYFLMFFLIVSFWAIYKKIAFYVLNSLIVCFNIYVYLIV